MKWKSEIEKLETIRNKNVSKVIVFGKNINNEFQDIFRENEDKEILNLELIEFDNESYIPSTNTFWQQLIPYNKNN